MNKFRKYITAALMAASMLVPSFSVADPHNIHGFQNNGRGRVEQPFRGNGRGGHDKNHGSSFGIFFGIPQPVYGCVDRAYDGRWIWNEQFHRWYHYDTTRCHYYWDNGEFYY